ncbi:TetR/AcrR family transcriptional regulator [Nakamurella leprariae]|uniref:TetR/AcrR family transcriptional regulator n=1 Tax=Nakamurella leprariae TaxID=2803911 RepID=A0A939BWX5_9ACTN|nr:TetR/AcrR family transcriptional regulator [Nakamurella leprariae]MBM9467978.1 TetR/AcrR family transcriptional regulator [Nakamurella leprariae]
MSRVDRAPRRRLDPDQRRAAILAAAEVAFRDQPYEQVALAEVARAAGGSEALLYRYFPTKGELYAALVRRTIAEIHTRQQDALTALPDGVPVRDRVRALVVVVLDMVAAHPQAFAASMLASHRDPEPAAAVRREARRADVDRLRDLLASSTTRRHVFALEGWFGLLDAACLHWAGLGCPADDREPLIAAALGALEGALGDWAA